ncbi:XdhC family protein [Chitinophaga japonensis]|uniref:Xanthine/CO dehydrogenase XdhC/CoxF family maturation factor n=1 Tax=Chitinophaga japonensis TaxID=104662 RepID=A0A562T034_CHIJA|nr:XdhC/CoxI family protein [Chitinophaga japonensis]TWI86658.1 xanthine/CO dehydrogenase XdhC/CoxF family maturation factor [Chitinophaga japonensis]
MKEIKDIVAAFDRAQQQGQQTALATVVGVEGSAYRRPGARMLITEDGSLTGAISGGCLEGDALRKAQQVMFRQQSMLVTYDTTDEDDAKLGVGLGCNGIIHILIEPIVPGAPHHPIQLLKDWLQQRQSAVLATLFSLDDRRGPQPGTALLLTANGARRHAFFDSAGWHQALIDDTEEALRTGMPLTRQYAQYTAFIEVLQAPVSLLVFGAGNDAIPLTALAGVLGWEATVIDGRPNYASLQRFPLAHRVLVAKPEQALQHLLIDQRTAAVLMTHNYNYDLAMLRQLLPLQLPYIGSLGPKKKLERMLEELRSEGPDIPAEQLQKVYGPTGLDIGAEGAEEIALSITAEIQTVLTASSGAPLRNKKAPIHESRRLEVGSEK